LDNIRKADEAVEALISLWANSAVPTLRDVLMSIADTGLFTVPDVFAPIVSRKELEEVDDEAATDSEEDEPDEDIEAWDSALAASFDQLEAYVQYISDESPYGTHQGIKGLQFPHVMVILDDNEARGFMFSYDKLMGAKPQSSGDEKNEMEGKETSIDRTRRLFYVTCSRAQSSLAIVIYTSAKDAMLSHLRSLQWFDDEEIIDTDSIHEEDI